MSIHKNVCDEEARRIFALYEEKSLSRAEAQQQLGVKDSQFYVWLAVYRANKQSFSVTYNRKTTNRKLPHNVAIHIRRELEQDKRLIDNPAIPIMFYNYSAIRDTVEETIDHSLSAQTVINYAKKWGYYIERPKSRKSHTREVLTTHIGMLLQHDASLHQWSPYAKDIRGKPIKWSLITTLDDHSRKLLYAEMFETESSWAHIRALESVTLTCGVGIKYYSDNHSIFRYVVDRDQHNHLNRVLDTDDVAPQWKQCVEAIGMKVVYAMSPEAKGKIERPYRWLQDRIVRRAAKEHANTINDVRRILRGEVERYNCRQVHSTTHEIPEKRFERALREGRSCFRPLDINATNPPVQSTKDIFCLRTQRRVNGYNQVMFGGTKLPVPRGLADGTPVTLHVIPSTDTTEIRFLHCQEILGYITIPTPKSMSLHSRG